MLALWNGIILNTAETTRLVIPRKKPLTFIIRTENSENITDLRLSFQSSSVLGVFSLNAQPPVGEVKLIEITPGNFSGAIESPNSNGLYSLVLKVQDIYGGFATEIVPYKVLITNPITITSASSHLPIEDAKFSISKMLPHSEIYFDLSQDFPIANFSNTAGELDLVLPAGKYRLAIDAVKYESLEKEFEINNSSSEYPQIALVPKFGLPPTISYFSRVLQKGFAYLQEVTVILTSSKFLQDFSLLMLVANTLISIVIARIVRLKNLRWSVWLILTIFWDFIVVFSTLLTVIMILNKGLLHSFLFVAITYCIVHIRFWEKIGLQMKIMLKKVRKI